MLGRTKRTRQADAGAAHDQQPLLNGSEEDLHHPQSDDVIFSVQDDDDDEYAEASALDAAEESPVPKSGHSVRFREDVQVIGPSLRSMTESRETGELAKHIISFMLLTGSATEYELDTDDLDDASLAQLATEQQSLSRSRRDRDQAMPLLVGLLDSATARRSLDGSLQLEHRGTAEEGIDPNDIDLEELAAKRTAGGGMLDSVANMANSILGAGTTIMALLVSWYTHYSRACIVGIIGNTLSIHTLLPHSSIVDLQGCHMPSVKQAL